MTPDRFRFNPETMSLDPPHFKTVVYVDQFVISEIVNAIDPHAKAHARVDPFWRQVFEAVERVSVRQRHARHAAYKRPARHGTTAQHGAGFLPSTADDVANSARIAPRHHFDLGIEADNRLHTDWTKVRVRFSAINLTNNEALGNACRRSGGRTS